nr:MAG TPA: hypothetical protein [Caudoviricetes sp.]
MNTINRIDTFISTLRIAHKTRVLSTYSSDTPTDKLVTLTGNVSDLCWNLAVATKHSNPANKRILAGGIKHNATNIVNICIAELKNIGHTTESAIELIATDGALWFWGTNQHPLDKLDQGIDPIDRIQSIHVATGHLMEWWPNKISPQNNVELNSELERTFTNLAYEAACAIIAHTR